MSRRMFGKRVKILLAGEGGQGIQKAAEILQLAAAAGGWQTSYLPHFGTEQRGGASFAFLQISRRPLGYPRFEKADILAITVSRALPKIQKFITSRTQIINLLKIRERPINMVMLGIIAKVFLLIPSFYFEQVIKKVLGHKPGLEKNLELFRFGLKLSPNDYSEDLPEFYRRFRSPKISKDAEKTYVRFPDQCKGCGLCITICPQKALYFSGEDVGVYHTPLPEVYLQKCIACGLCEQICPEGAIKVTKDISS